LKVWLERTLARISSKSDLAVAIRYTLSRWQALTLMLRCQSARERDPLSASKRDPVRCDLFEARGVSLFG
jgi:hypothetical protein